MNSLRKRPAMDHAEEEDRSEPEDPAVHREREEEQPEGGRRHQVHPGELSAQGGQIFTFISQLQGDNYGW